MAGVENKGTVFLFTDTQVVEEGFLEDINNILSSGEVPNLYKPDEFEEVSRDWDCCGYRNRLKEEYSETSLRTLSREDTSLERTLIFGSK